ncbi:MAG: IS21 family transposase [Deltaproteobacteria bacterium]|nr:IS21 family transposase [Deltaproteobacteria bacterium]
MSKHRKKEIGMRKLKDLLRLKSLGMSQNQTERALKVSGKTIRKYWGRAEEVSLVYSEALSEEELERKLILDFKEKPAREPVNVCDWQRIADEVVKSKVGLSILWEEECAAGRFRLSYSQFCRHFERVHRRSAFSFHKEYEPGKVAEVDFTDGIPILDLKTGELMDTQLFLMVLGASRFTYGEFCLSQDLPTWLNLHTHAFEYFGGVPELTTPDNLKSGITKPCRYEPQINPSYTEYAAHYGFAVLPARVRKPKDKPLVERAAQIFQKWFYQRHRHRRFTSLSELNGQLWADLEIFHEKPHRRFGESRRSRFDRLEKGSLKALPERGFELSCWKKAKQHPDSHIAFENSFYSASYLYRGEIHDIRATVSTVEIYRKGVRIAVHLRASHRGQFRTQKEHLPPGHQALLEITPQRLLDEAKSVGECTVRMLEEILAKRSHPALGLRSCQGVMRLGSRYGSKRLEAACRRALEYKALNFKAVNQILQKGLDQETQTPPDWDPQQRLQSHLRGKDYYH